MSSYTWDWVLFSLNAMKKMVLLGGGLLFFLEIPRNAYLLIHIERNGSYTNLKFAKIEKKIKKSMLVLYRTEVEDLFEYWVHRNKVFFFWRFFFLVFNHNFDSHSFVLIDLVRPTSTLHAYL